MNKRKNNINTIFEEILTDISENGMSLTDALKVNPKSRKSKLNKISKPTFYLLLEDDKVKADRYARACEERAELMADSMLTIADSKRIDVNRDKLRVDTRKWLLSKLQPKKYGDKIDITTKDKPLQSNTYIVDDSETAKILKELKAGISRNEDAKEPDKK